MYIALRYLRVMCLTLLVFALTSSFGVGSGPDETARATLVERIDAPDRLVSQGNRQTVVAAAEGDTRDGDHSLFTVFAQACLGCSHRFDVNKADAGISLRKQRANLRTPIRAPPFIV